MATDLEVLQDICDSYADEINRLVARNDALIANERRLLDKLQKYADAVSEIQVERDDIGDPYVFFKKVNGKDEWSSWNEFSDGSGDGKPLYEHHGRIK